MKKTYAIFIAKDHDEFTNYQGDEISFGGSVPVRSPKGRPRQKDHKASGSGVKQKVDCQGDLSLIVLDRDPCVDILRKKQLDATDDQVGAFYDYISKKCNTGEDDDVFVFCHWGQGGSRAGVNALDWRLTRRLTDFARGTPYAKWKICAISSQRPDIFAVEDDNRIAKAKYGIRTLPSTVDAVDDIANKLQEERKKFYSCTYDEFKKRVYASHDIKDCVFKDKKFLIVPVTEDVNDLVQNIMQILGEFDDKCLIDLTEDGSRFYPLFVDYEYVSSGNEVVRYMDGSGLMVPDEFVLRFIKDSQKSDVEQTVDLFKSIELRLKAWDGDAILKNGLKFSDLQDWMAGVFRRFCMLDEDVHGTGDADTIDLSALKKFVEGESEQYEQGWNSKKNALQANYDKLCQTSGCVKLLRKVYGQSMEALNRCLCESDPKKAAKIFLENVVYKPYGSQVAYLSPVGRLSCLLVDDEAANAKDEITRVRLGVKTLGEVIDIKAITVTAKYRKTVIDQAIDSFRTIIKNHETYDFVLLDLRLADKAGADPSGYQLIKVVKQFLPQMPIVIYSRYDDMGHISRAFVAGADWFVRKEDVGKLPRHLISLLSLWHWRKEWDSLRNLQLCNDEAFDFVNCNTFSNEQKYLAYKVLENLPGKNIHVKTMGGGMSSAVTFKAWKTVGDKGENLQNPVIVKIDSAFNTMTEYERYFRFIRPYIANECGRIEARNKIVDKDNSAIVYSFAGKNDPSHSLSTMKEQLAKDIKFLSRCDYEKYAHVFDTIFDDILPKIHRVSPKLEIEEGLSSYPNPIFGEYFGEKEIAKGGFVGNYLSRMPIANYYKVEQFVSQEFYEEKEENRKGVSRFEFHGIWEYDGHKAIEAYEIENGYPKLTAILTGEVAELVVKYRKPVPGQTLYAKVELVHKCLQDKTILDKIDERLAKEKFFYGKAESDGTGTKEVIRRTVFEELLKAFLSVDQVSAPYETFVSSEYKKIEELLDSTKSNSNLSFKCDVGIVHGDMNYANIMLDEKNGRPDKDVWLIDFAKTRRDIIAHDFNVMFSATISLLFDNSLWNDPGVGTDDRYAKRLIKIFFKFIHDVMMSDHDEEPDYVANDKRFTLVYKILRRIRKAALKIDALGNARMTLDMYILTTALCCLYTFKIYLRHDNNIQAAAGFLAIAHICIEELKKKSAS